MDGNSFFCGSQNVEVSTTPPPTTDGIINTPFSGVWVNESSIPTTSLSQFRAIVAVGGGGGGGGNSLGSIFDILRSRTLRMSDTEDISV